MNERHFVVMEGERGEGGHVLGVFSDEAAARELYTRQRKQLEERWHKVYPERPPGQMGCDWVSLVRWEGEKSEWLP